MPPHDRTPSELDDMVSGLAFNLNWTSITADLKAAASENGFQLNGVVLAQDAPDYDRFCQWLDRGYAGSMQYLTVRREAYEHPRHVMVGVQSILMLGMPYKSPEPHPATIPGRGRVASYASGLRDYHDVIQASLKELKRHILNRCPDALVRGVVDTSPLLERDFARLAGIGWIGKNTLLLSRTNGSYFFIAALLTDLPLISDRAFESDHCGTCTACLDACPTQAFPEPYVLDARRCISYLTIENKGSVPVDLREGIGDWLFGCDICQQVCPWNRKSPAATQPEITPQLDRASIDLLGLLELSDDRFRERYRQTPLWRSRRRGILRNAMIVIGNQRMTDAIQPLTRFLSDEDEVLRETAAWALAQITNATTWN